VGERKVLIYIKIESETVWLIYDESEINISKSGIGENEKIFAYAYITSYQEKPYFFDEYGNPKMFSVQVSVRYKIVCGTYGEIGGTDFEYKKVKEGSFFVSDSFPASSFSSHLSGIKRVREKLKEKIKNEIVMLSLKLC